MPHKIDHPVRDKIIRNPVKLLPVLKKELLYEKLKYQQKNNMFK
jgi:hypothetical protein